MQAIYSSVMHCKAHDREELLLNTILTGEGPDAESLRYKLEDDVTGILRSVTATEARKVSIYTPTESSISVWLGLNSIATRLDRDTPGSWVGMVCCWRVVMCCAGSAAGRVCEPTGIRRIWGRQRIFSRASAGAVRLVSHDADGHHRPPQIIHLWSEYHASHMSPIYFYIPFSMSPLTHDRSGII